MHEDDFLAACLKSYLHTALIACHAPEGWALSSRYTVEDFTLSSTESARNDVRRFIEEAGEVLDRWLMAPGHNAEEAGAILFLDRNRLGSYFSDTDEDEGGEFWTLSELAKKLGTSFAYDDYACETVYLSEKDP